MNTAETDRGGGLIERVVLRSAITAARGVARIGPLRRALVSHLERRMRAQAARPASELRHPPAVEADKLAMKLAVLRIFETALTEDRLSDSALSGFTRNLVRDVLMRRGDSGAKQRFRECFGSTPPDFLVISPGRACNLTCVGCYAASGPVREKLPWATLERVVREAHDLWGMRFFVISGGEPLAYRDEGRGILDLAERHPDCFFMMYTNGTLITDEVARRMAALGNLMPGLSIEGMQELTDARRGAGVFDKVVTAIDRLRREKVLFGLSVTATRENAEQVLSDDVVRFFFREKGALFAWVFHYMPIGRAPTLDLMMTPEQRVRLWERVWHLVREERIFLADFWNSGTVTNGCVAGGRAGGYLYINWDGFVSPCVFIPYAPANIKDVHARGDTLNEAWASPFFAGIRSWQRDYGYREVGEKAPEGCGNWLNPCIIRDHHARFQELVREHQPTPIDADARAALDDPAYHAGLEAYDRQLAALNDPIWRSRYLASCSCVSTPEPERAPATSTAPAQEPSEG